MLFQTAGLLKSLATLGAVINTATLRTVVPEFFQRGRKALPAFDTKICGVFALAQPVAGQQRSRSKSSPTLGAIKRMEPRVNPLVFNEDGVMFETFVALGAFMHSRLGSVVGGQ